MKYAFGIGPQRKLVKRIQQFICKQSDIDMADLLGESRVASLVQVRHVAMSASRTLTGLSSYSLAQLFSRADHVTVLHAIKRVSGNSQLKSSALAVVKHFHAHEQLR